MDMYKYRLRLYTETDMQKMSITTKDIINNTFHEAPNYLEVYLNGELVDARIDTNEEKNTKKNVLFRPDTEIYKGDIINFNETHWLVTNTFDNDIYPTAYCDLCNEWLRWEDDDNVLKVYPCVIKTEMISLDEGKYDNRWIVMSENIITILVPYNNDTKTIEPQQRFIFNGLPFEIKGIDLLTNVSQGKGYIQLRAEQGLREIDDDNENQVADNDPNGWGGWTT